MGRKSPFQSKNLNDTHDIMTFMTHVHRHVGNDNQHMTSLEIDELTGKQHFHVMEAIRKMEPAWMKIAESKFRLGSYKDANGQLRPCYQLTKTECLYIATKFNDEARAKLTLSLSVWTWSSASREPSSTASA